MGRKLPGIYQHGDGRWWVDKVVGGREFPNGARGGKGRSGACSAASVSCTVQERCSLVSTSKKPVRS